MIKLTKGIYRAAFGLGGTVRCTFLFIFLILLIMQYASQPLTVFNTHQKSLPRFLSTKVDSFLGGSNAIYVDQMYSAWKQDPKRYFNALIIQRLFYFNFSRFKTRRSIQCACFLVSLFLQP
jgi:hypothetical protein